MHGLTLYSHKGMIYTKSQVASTEECKHLNVSCPCESNKQTNSSIIMLELQYKLVKYYHEGRGIYSEQ